MARCWTNPLLEPRKVSGAEGISLGDNGDEVDPGAEALHDLDVEGLEGVAGRADEVEAGVDAEVDLVLPAGLLLLQHVRLVLVIEELDYGHPRIPVVDVVAEAGGIDDGKTDCRRGLAEGQGEGCLQGRSEANRGLREAYP